MFSQSTDCGHLSSLSCDCSHSVTSRFFSHTYACAQTQHPIMRTSSDDVRAAAATRCTRRQSETGAYVDGALGLDEPAPDHRLELPVAHVRVGGADLTLDVLLQQEALQSPVQVRAARAPVQDVLSTHRTHVTHRRTSHTPCTTWCTHGTCTTTKKKHIISESQKSNKRNLDEHKNDAYDDASLVVHSPGRVVQIRELHCHLSVHGQQLRLPLPHLSLQRCLLLLGTMSHNQRSYARTSSLTRVCCMP